MSISKRFALYLSIITVIAFIMMITSMSWVIKVSPAINDSIDFVTDDIYNQFIAMGYADDSWNLVRPDPNDNQDSVVKLTFSNKGVLESANCSTAYINTRSTNDIYSDIEASMKILGAAPDSCKAEIIKAIEDIRAGGSVNVGGDLEKGNWGVGSSTFNDKQGGKLRYVCFTVWKKY